MRQQGTVTPAAGDGINAPMGGQHNYQMEQPQVLNVTPLPVSLVICYFLFLFVTLSGGRMCLLLCSCF